jgi:hypothetical protein
MMVGLLVLSAPLLHAQVNPDWTTPIAPFRVAGNLYYVGGKDLASYLVVTPQGDILINSSLEASVPMIRSSVEQLGFKFKDIKMARKSASAEREQAFEKELRRQQDLLTSKDPSAAPRTGAG